eukprot:12905260-Prorocentrum_lima.AAC.1
MGRKGGRVVPPPHLWEVQQGPRQDFIPGEMVVPPRGEQGPQASVIAMVDWSPAGQIDHVLLS